MAEEPLPQPVPQQPQPAPQEAPPDPQHPTAPGDLSKTPAARQAQDSSLKPQAASLKPVSGESPAAGQPAAPPQPVLGVGTAGMRRPGEETAADKLLKREPPPDPGGKGGVMEQITASLARIEAQNEEILEHMRQPARF